jgi:hypothetical protein
MLYEGEDVRYSLSWEGDKLTTRSVEIDGLGLRGTEFHDKLVSSEPGSRVR